MSPTRRMERVLKLFLKGIAVLFGRRIVAYAKAICGCGLALAASTSRGVGFAVRAVIVVAFVVFPLAYEIQGSPTSDTACNKNRLRFIHPVCYVTLEGLNRRAFSSVSASRLLLADTHGNVSKTVFDV